MTRWVVAAVKDELNLLIEAFQAAPRKKLGSRPTYWAKTSRGPLILSVLGIGVVSAAMRLGRLAAFGRPDEVIMVGSAGALPKSNLRTGDVVAAEVEIMAELGLTCGLGLADAAALGLDGVEQELALDRDLTQRIIDAGGRTANIHPGRMLTVMGVTANHNQARARSRRFRALAENMEGYALAWAGWRWQVPVAEFRGVGNRAGNRNKETWNLELAAENAQRVVLNYLES